MFETLTAIVDSPAATAIVGYELPAAWRGITKAAYFIGFTMVMGSTVVHSLVLRRALRAHETSQQNGSVLRQRSAIALALSGFVFLLSLWPQLAGKVARAGAGMPFDMALLPDNVWSYLTLSAPVGIPLGTMVLIQFSIFTICSLLLISLAVPAMRRRMDFIAGVAAIGTAVASVMLGLSGDLAGQDIDAWMHKLPSYVHVLSGATWVGGVVALAALGLARRRLTSDAGLVWAYMWKRFSRIAQFCVGGIIVSGLWMTWNVVSSPVELVTTTFGRLLLLKVALVAILIALGAFNECVLLPRIVRLRAYGDHRGLFTVAVRHFPQVVLAEAVIGLCVLLVVPFLNGSAREEAGAPEAHATTTMFVATAALIAILVVSFVLNARVQGEVERAHHQAAQVSDETVSDETVSGGRAGSSSPQKPVRLFTPGDRG